jgi:hypothetical protein
VAGHLEDAAHRAHEVVHHLNAGGRQRVAHRRNGGALETGKKMMFLIHELIRVVMRLSSF